MISWISLLLYFFAIFLAVFSIWREARNRGLSEEKVLDLLVLACIAALLGGRIGFCLEHLSLFQPNMIRFFLVLKYPGISILGLAASGFLCSAFLARRYKLGAIYFLDLITIPILSSVTLLLLGCSVYTCYGVSKARVLPGALFLFGGILLVWLLKYELLNWSLLAKVKRANGLIFYLSLVFLQALSFVVAKNMDPRIYSFLIIGIAIELILIVIYYWEVFVVISFPPNLLGQIKQHLEQRLSDVEHRLTLLRREDPASDKGRLLEVHSDDDEATNEAAHERVQALQVQLSKTLIDIRKALTKIKVGSYGICESCGKMIDTDRLAAMPSATLCVDCEIKKEKGKLKNKSVNQ